MGADALNQQDVHQRRERQEQEAEAWDGMNPAEGGRPSMAGRASQATHSSMMHRERRDNSGQAPPELLFDLILIPVPFLK